MGNIDMMNISNSSGSRGGKKRGTFVVKVEYCQNESWQGQVVWADENKTQRFRSMLELIKIMDGAMVQGAESGENLENSVS